MADVKAGHAITLRAERALVTRDRIVAAARTLFARDGYGATTLTAIATEAGVAVQTVYAVFGSKAGILRALRQSVVDQPEADALFGEAIQAASPKRKLKLFARSIRRRWEAGHDIVAIDGQAATTDAAVRSEVEQAMARRRAGIGRLAASLPAPVDVARATATLDALTLPEVYRELIEVHGWTPDDYETWLAEALRALIIGR